MTATEMAFHPEFIYGRSVVHAHFAFLCIVSKIMRNFKILRVFIQKLRKFYTFKNGVPNAHSNVIVTAFTPNVVRHFESDDENAQMQFSGTFAEGVSAHEFVKSPFGRVIVRRVVFVCPFTFSLQNLRKKGEKTGILETKCGFYGILLTIFNNIWLLNWLINAEKV